MIAIADSGTTKTSWFFVDDNNNKYTYKTIGFNPYYQTSDNIYSNLKDGLIPNLDFKEKVDKIYFYGAGCELQEKRQEVLKGIKQAFPDTDVYVDHDLLAAAKALFGDKEGIACISGTGSNSCEYDGQKILRNVHSLGLYLGDEGSGGHKGKLLIIDYIRLDMPTHIREKLEQFTQDRGPEMLDKIYTKPFPSRYLASYFKFIAGNLEDEYIKNLVRTSYRSQFKNCIAKYERHKTWPVGFIGSVAFFAQDLLKEVAAEYGCNVTSVIRNPLEALAEYHKNKGWV